MAKRVAAQRRGLLYGMIAAIFAAVLMAVFLFIKTNELEEYRKFVANPADPARAVDVEHQRATVKARIGTLKDAGVLPFKGGVGMLDAINGYETWYTAAREAAAMLGQEISGDSLQGISGEAMKIKAREIQGASQRTLKGAAAALTLAPRASVPGTEVQTPGTLKQAIDQMAVHIGALATDNKTKTDKIATLDSDVAAAKQNGANELAALKEAFEAAKTAKDTQIADLQKQVGEALAQTDTVRDEYNGARKAHNTDIADYKSQIQKKVEEIIALDARLAELSVRIGRALGREFEPDGAVITLKPGETTGYINRGTAHSVFNGLTFSVFDPSELGKVPPMPKGAIRLTKVMLHSSEFRIVVQSPSNPIVVGDVITNPAYDLERPFHFTLVGKFDIGNDRTEDTSRIAQLITDFGGKVQNRISVETDYLVVGDDPMNWAPKGTGPQVQIIIKKLQEEQKQMGLATDMAKRLHIPVLNLNRFMSLMGQVSHSAR